MPCCSGRPEFEPYGHSGISQRDVRQFYMSWKDMLRPRQINFSAFVTFFSGIGSDVRLKRHKKRAARLGEIMSNRERLSLYGCGSAALGYRTVAAPVAACAWVLEQKRR